MEKKIYDTPKIAMMEVETASMIASSVKYNEQAGTGGSVDFSGANDVSEENANSARVASNKYFDSWDEE